MDSRNDDAVLWDFPELPDPMGHLVPNNNMDISSFSDEDEEAEDEKAKLEQELASLKAEYEHKIQLLNNMMHEIKSMGDLFDQEMIQVMQLLIKKICKKIIIKEVTNDADVLCQMIQEVMKDINEDDLVCIFLSEQDFNLIKTEQLPFTQYIKIDPQLSVGDMKIRKKTGEIIALLDNRIELVMKSNHE
jgi:flagellar biosynthesis/type III secretory pathway protein FliH